MDELPRKRTIVRHDSVTARAISRLSHGVSQLTACSNAITPRCMFRMRRRKFPVTAEPSKKCCPYEHQTPSTEEHNLTLDYTKENRSTLKRKRQSDKRLSHNSMDIDDASPVSHSTNPSNNFSVFSPNVVTDENSFFPAPFSFSTRVGLMSSDAFSLRATSPSCSSMLSLTSSSVDQGDSDSSHEQEADAEDDDDMERNLGLKNKISHSCTDLLGTSVSLISSKGRQSDKRSGKPQIHPKHHNYGGDSSDGLPTGIKIPRLTVDSTASCSTQRQGRLKAESSRTIRNPAILFNAANSVDQYSYSDRKAASNSLRKVGRLRCVHSESRSLSRHGTVCKCESSTSSSPSSTGYSLSPEFGHASASCEDLANDEQSDFPAEEYMPSKNCRPYMGSHARPLKHHTGTGEVNRGQRHVKHAHLPRVFGASSVPGESRNDADRDSELEEIFNGTWPFLSRRAKLGYIKGVSQSGTRNSNMGADAETTLPTRNKKGVTFVPSKLDSFDPLGSPSTDSPPLRGVGKRPPTPPWLAADDEFEQADSPIVGMSSCSGDHKGCKGDHPGLGYSKPKLCDIPPVNATNLGHRLLRKLGWEPGQGLGITNQGSLDPIGCVPHPDFPSFPYTIAST